MRRLRQCRSMKRYRFFFPARKGLLADTNGVLRMWRSFFYAVGIGLFALGLQTLVVEHVTVPQNTRFQKLLKKIFENDKPFAGNVQPGLQQLSAPGANQVAPNWARQASDQSYGVNTGSRFGPSRFAGSAYGTGYGGQRVNSTFGNAGFNTPQYGNSPQYQNQGQTNAQLAGYSSPGQIGSANPQLRVQKIVVREWMPWSLLASGAIIFLYTRSHHQGRNDD